VVLEHRDKTEVKVLPVRAENLDETELPETQVARVSRVRLDHLVGQVILGRQVHLARLDSWAEKVLQVQLVELERLVILGQWEARDLQG